MTWFMAETDLKIISIMDAKAKTIFIPNIPNMYICYETNLEQVSILFDYVLIFKAL